MQERQSQQKYSDQPQNHEESRQNQHLKCQTNVASQFLSSYMSFFDQLPETNTTKMPPSFKRISFIPQKFTSQLIIRIKNHQRNMNTAVLHIHYGYFECQVSVIVSSQRSHLHSPVHLHPPVLQLIETKYSNNYLLSHKEKDYIVKCTSIKSQKRKTRRFVEVVKEYTLAKIASQLNIGPRVAQEFGFQIFVYNDCIQFFIERQIDHNKYQKYLQQNSIKKLKEKLRLLHSFKIVHYDIKPHNIVYSQTKRQFVFIDFGFSKVINEDIGFKTLTYFAGTPNYCGPEMRNLMNQSFIQNKQRIFVDLYYNDAYSLNASIQELIAKSKLIVPDQQNDEVVISSLELIGTIASNKNFINEPQKVSQEAEQKMKEIRKKNYMMRLSFEIFTNNIKIVNNPFFRKFISENFQQTLALLSEFKYSQTVQNIYNFISSLPNCQKSGILSQVNIQAKKYYQVMECEQEKGVVATNNLLTIMKLHDKDSFNIQNGQFKAVFIVKEGKYSILFNKEALQSIPKYQYYSLLFEYLPQYYDASSYLYQLKACQLFIQNQKIDVTKFKTVGKYQKFQICLNFMLQFFISTLQKGFQQLIPRLIKKLILMESISAKQLLQISSKILSINCDQSIFIVLLFYFRLSIDYIDIVLFVGSELYDAYDVIYTQVKVRLQTVKSIKYGQLVEVIMFLLYQDSDHISELQICRISQKNQSLKGVSQYFKKHVEKCLQIKKINHSQTGFLSFSLEKDIFVLEEAALDDRIQVKNNRNELVFHTHIFEKCSKSHKKNNVYVKFRFSFDFLISSQEEYLLAKFLEVGQNCKRNAQIFQKYETIFKFHGILINPQQTGKICEQSRIVGKYKQFFTVNFEEITKLNDINQLISKHQIHLLFLRLIMVTQIYMFLYNPQDNQLRFLPKLQQEIQDILPLIHCEDCRFKCTLTLYQLKIGVAKFFNHRDSIIHITSQQISFYFGFPQKVKFYNVQIFFTIRMLIDQLLKQDSRDQARNQIAEARTFIYQIIRKQKYFLLGLTIRQSEHAFYFMYQCIFTSPNFIKNIVEIHQDIGNFIQSYPNLEYICNYEYQFILTIEQYIQSWKQYTPTIFDEIFSHFQQNKFSHLLCLFLALLIPYCDLTNLHFKKAIYVICSSVDLVATKAKTITLTHFFTYFLFKAGIILNSREKRFKIIKFSSYVNLKKEMPLDQFLKHIKAKAIYRNQRKSVAFKTLAKKIENFYQNGYKN